MSQTRVRILNWDKYNAKRADVKKPSWYREENTSAQSRSLYGIHATDRYVFHVLKGLASKEQTDELIFEADWFCDVEGARSFSRFEFDLALRTLNGRVIEVLEHVPLPLRARDVNVTLRTDGRTDEESVAAPLSLQPPPQEKIAPPSNEKHSDPTHRADTAALDPVPVDDPEIRDWLHELGIGGRGYSSWLTTYAGGDHVRLLGFVRQIHARAVEDPTFFDPLQQRGNQTRKQRILDVFTRRLKKSADDFKNPNAPPGGGGVRQLRSYAEINAESNERLREKIRRGDDA